MPNERNTETCEYCFETVSDLSDHYPTCKPKERTDMAIKWATLAGKIGPVDAITQNYRRKK